MSVFSEVVKFGKGLLAVLDDLPIGGISQIASLALGLFDRVSDIVSETGIEDAEELKAIRDELEQRVLAHAEATANRLRGE